MELLSLHLAGLEWYCLLLEESSEFDMHTCNKICACIKYWFMHIMLLQLIDVKDKAIDEVHPTIVHSMQLVCYISTT